MRTKYTPEVAGRLEIRIDDIALYRESLDQLSDYVWTLSKTRVGRSNAHAVTHRLRSRTVRKNTTITFDLDATTSLDRKPIWRLNKNGTVTMIDIHAIWTVAHEGFERGANYMLKEIASAFGNGNLLTKQKFHNIKERLVNVERLLSPTAKYKLAVAMHLQEKYPALSIRPDTLYSLDERIKKTGRTYLRSVVGQGSKTRNIIRDVFRSPRKSHAMVSD